MKTKNSADAANRYDDGDIPEIDLPQNDGDGYTEPLPEYTRPRRDGPGGD